MPFLSIIPFFCIVFSMYWSLPIFCTLGYIQSFKFWGARSDCFGWSEGLRRFFGVRVVKLNDEPVHKTRCIFLCNHRSWTDFFMDVYVTDGRGIMLSRLAVLYAFPMFMIGVRSIKGVLLFKRGHIRDKVKFNNWIDEELAEATQPGLIVYPEGHRSTATASLPLKRGMLHYAHSRNMPVQIVMTKNKEHLLSEKSMSARLGVTLAVAHSKAIVPGDYKDFEDFMAAVQSSWDALWQMVYSTKDEESFPDFVPDPIPCYLSAFVKARFAVITLGAYAAFLVIVGGSLYAAWRLLQFLPIAVQVGIVSLLLILHVVAFSSAWVPKKPRATKATSLGQHDLPNGTIKKQQ